MMTEQEVIKLVADALVVDSAKLNMSSNSQNVEGWDSMGTMNILLCLDSECGLKLQTGETKQLQSMAGIMELLQKAGKL